MLPHGIRDVPINFPIFRGPIPHDSIVLIAYSVAGYPAKRYPKDTSISLNIVWAAVLATDEDPYVYFLFPLSPFLSLRFVSGSPCAKYWPRVFFHDDPLIEMLESLLPE